MPLIIIGVMAGLAAVTIGLHMARPRSNRRIVSSAPFFQRLPVAERSSRRWSISNPLSLPLLARLLVLSLLLWALIPLLFSLTRPSTQGIALWVLLDTSGSQAAEENGNKRIDSAKEEIEHAISAARTEVGDGPICLRLSTFDIVSKHWPPTTNIESFLQTLETVRPRALGTDLSLVREIVTSEEVNGDCPTTGLAPRGIASVLSEESGKDGSQVIVVPCGFEPFVSHPKFG